MSVWPDVVDRLVAWLPTLTGWGAVKVYDGPTVTSAAPKAYVTVAFVLGEDFGGSYEQARGTGDFTEENGTVRSELVCWSGGSDLPAVRDQAFALADAWQAAVDADPSLDGVLTGGGSASLSVDVQPIQTTDNATQRLTVTLSYVARY